MIRMINMGLETPVIARGIDPHAFYRQSTMTLDAIAKKRALYAHDPAIVASLAGRPAFIDFKDPEIANEATFEAFLAGIVLARTGIAVAGTDDEEKIARSLNIYLRNSLYTIWGGREEAEAPMIDQGYAPHDSSRDAAFKMGDVYVTKLRVPAVDPADIGDIVREGTLTFCVDTARDAGDRVVLGAYRDSADLPGTQSQYQIYGSTIINTGIVTDAAGNEHTVVDVVI